MAPPASSASLAGCTIALAGSHAVCPDLSHHSVGDLKTYIAGQGGAYASKVTDECTHLIANEKQYDAKGAKVKQAAKNTATKMVTYEWLVKSLSSKKKVDDSSYFLGTGNTAATAPTISKGTKPSKSTKRKRDDSSEGEKDDTADSAPQPRRQISQVSAAKTAPVNIPVDEWCDLRGSHNVYQDGDGVIYDVTLNQTNAGQNNNKFYRIQLLAGLNGQDHRTWTRWGRVGERGQSAMLGSGLLNEALTNFDKKFKDKTGHKWDSRHEPAKKGKYTYIERNYEESDEDGQNNLPGAGTHRSSKQSLDSSEISKVESKLPKAVQDLMTFIFNTEMFNQAMASMDYDAHKMPLGKLSKRTLTQGYRILKDVAALIGNHSLAESEYGQSLGETLEALSNSYFSTIPHAFGRNRPPVIQDARLVKKEIELIESLTDMQLANEIMKTAKGDKEENDIHLLDRQYEGLRMREMTPLDSRSEEYKHLQNYLIKSAGKTHHIQYKVQEIFRIERQGEETRFRNSSYAAIKNSDRRLLWHGSRSTNYGGILSQGLRIAPIEAPSTGLMFGKGVYLADISTKSANYCWARSSGGTGLLLLCEAELGDPSLKLFDADSNAGETAKKHGCISTWGVGTTAPKGWKDAACVHKDLKGVKMPDVSVEPGNANESKAFLQYNEYIVYDISQIRLRYLLRVQM